jgi:hypothetical protein
VVRRLASATASAGALGLLLAGSPAPAQDSPAPDSPTPVQESSRPSFRWLRFELHGRLLARALSTREQGETSSDLDAENARLELRWRPARWLRGVVEYDQAEHTHLKDAYFALRSSRNEVRIGRFKPPFSPLEMASRWELPASERGLLSDVLIDLFGVAGRRPGVQLGWNRKGGGLSAAAGVFRASSVRGDRIGDEAFNDLAQDWSALKTTGRLAWQRHRLEIGGAFDLRPAEPVPGGGYRRFWTAGADLTWSAPRRGGPRAWLEGYLGASWQDANAFDGRDATFLAGRALAAWRFGSLKGRALYVEPFAMGSLLDPDASVREDVLWEAAGGLCAGGFGHARVVLEVQHRSVSRNAPASLGLLALGQAAPRARTRLVAQVGAAF